MMAMVKQDMGQSKSTVKLRAIECGDDRETVMKLQTSLAVNGVKIEYE